MANGSLVPRPAQAAQFPHLAAAADVAVGMAENQFGNGQIQQWMANVNNVLAGLCSKADGIQRNYVNNPGGPNPGPYCAPPKHDCGCGGKCGGGGNCKGPQCRVPGDGHGDGGCGGRPGDGYGGGGGHGGHGGGDGWGQPGGPGGGHCRPHCDPPSQCLPPGRDPPPNWHPPGDGGYLNGDPCIPLSPGGIPRGAVPLLFNLPPACYDCACLDPCLYPALLFARQAFDPWLWAAAWENESDLVHLNQQAGALPGFNDPPLPIIANTCSFFAQQPGQVLPFIPGLIKVNVTWSGTPAPAAVDLQFYTGPNPTITGVQPAQLVPPTGGGLGTFAVMGRPYNLADFECGTSCYVQEAPRIFRCTPGAIPYTRAIYVKVCAGALPANSTITSLSITVLKQGTRQYANCCNEYKFPMFGRGCGRPDGIYRDASTRVWGNMLGVGYSA